MYAVFITLLTEQHRSSGDIWLIPALGKISSFDIDIYHSQVFDSMHSPLLIQQKYFEYISVYVSNE